MIDEKWSARFRSHDQIRSHGAKVVVSRHDFNEVPPDFGSWPERIENSGADVVKVVGMARNPDDTRRVVDVLEPAQR